ncbi:hypothetical protein LG3211_0475 [Lysobacter gummosus]|nr:hypothetical protein LG3211_0475 [Lysobacter gummosus]
MFRLAGRGCLTAVIGAIADEPSSRHSREGGNPVPFVRERLKSLFGSAEVKRSLPSRE